VVALEARQAELTGRVEELQMAETQFSVSVKELQAEDEAARVELARLQKAADDARFNISQQFAPDHPAASPPVAAESEEERVRREAEELVKRQEEERLRLEEEERLEREAEERRPVRCAEPLQESAEMRAARQQLEIDKMDRLASAKEQLTFCHAKETMLAETLLVAQAQIAEKETEIVQHDAALHDRERWLDEREREVRERSMSLGLEMEAFAVEKNKVDELRTKLTDEEKMLRDRMSAFELLQTYKKRQLKYDEQLVDAKSAKMLDLRQRMRDGEGVSNDVVELQLELAELRQSNKLLKTEAESLLAAQHAVQRTADEARLDTDVLEKEARVQAEANARLEAALAARQQALLEAQGALGESCARVERLNAEVAQLQKRLNVKTDLATAEAQTDNSLMQQARVMRQRRLTNRGI
jgi:hypothetical protein